MQIFVKPSHIRLLLRLSQIIDRITEVIGGLSSWMVILAVAVGFYNVIARYIGRLIGIKLSSNALIELQWYLFSIMFFLGFAYILKHAANVRVDFLYTNWSPKRQALVDFLGTVFFLDSFLFVRHLGEYQSCIAVLGTVTGWNLGGLGGVLRRGWFATGTD